MYNTYRFAYMLQEGRGAKEALEVLLRDELEFEPAKFVNLYSVGDLIPLPWTKQLEVFKMLTALGLSNDSAVCELLDQCFKLHRYDRITDLVTEVGSLFSRMTSSPRRHDWRDCDASRELLRALAGYRSPTGATLDHRFLTSILVQLPPALIEYAWPLFAIRVDSLPRTTRGILHRALVHVNKLTVYQSAVAAGLDYADHISKTISAAVSNECREILGFWARHGQQLNLLGRIPSQVIMIHLAEKRDAAMLAQITQILYHYDDHLRYMLIRVINLHDVKLLTVMLSAWQKNQNYNLTAMRNIYLRANRETQAVLARFDPRLATPATEAHDSDSD